MELQEIRNAIAQLNAATDYLEDLYVQNEGEITEEVYSEEDRVAMLRELLEGDAIDSLGRWLKAKEDQAAALKAEKDHLARMQKAAENTVAFVKGEIFSVLAALGKDAAKGTSYGFKAYHSRKVEADKGLLKERYQQKALDAIHGAGIPECVGLTLTASSSQVEGDLPDFFNVTEEDTIRFQKPRKAEQFTNS